MSTRKDSLPGGLSGGGLLLQHDLPASPRQLIAGALAQLTRVWKLLLFLYVPFLLLFVGLKTISHFSEQITLSYFTRDIAAIAHLPFYAGFVSQIGGLLWAASLAICIFTLVAIGKQPPDFARTRRWLIQASILTAILMFDDVFQFHEEIGEDYLGLSEKLIILSYLGIAFIFVLTSFREIINSEYLILGLALFWFGMSVFLDAVNLEEVGAIGRFFSDQFHTFAEDGLKFAGVATWLVYFARYGYQKIKGLPPS